jgi:hypothetical protein
VEGYFRASGGDEQERSVDQRRRVAEEYCQHHLVLVRIFADEARPGSTIAGRRSQAPGLHRHLSLGQHPTGRHWPHLRGHARVEGGLSSVYRYAEGNSLASIGGEHVLEPWIFSSWWPDSHITFVLAFWHPQSGSL